MSNYTYKQVLNLAKSCQKNIKKEYKLGITNKWAYFFAKAILQPNKVYNQFYYPAPAKPIGDYLSRQIVKNDYLDCCKRLVKYVETNKRMPSYIKWKNFKINPNLFTEVLSRILIYYDEHKTLPKYANINSKVFKEETETGNVVYDYFTKKTGKKFKTIDDFLTYIQKNYHYEYYYDDHKSNKQVIDSKAGNCTDLLQMMCNYVEAMGYSWKCVHVKCRVSGAGHVFGKFKKQGDWFVRDIASVADGGSISSVWCRDGIVLSENPQWWLNNLRR